MRFRRRVVSNIRYRYLSGLYSNSQDIYTIFFQARCRSSSFSQNQNLLVQLVPSGVGIKSIAIDHWTNKTFWGDSLYWDGDRTLKSLPIPAVYCREGIVTKILSMGLLYFLCSIFGIYTPLATRRSVCTTNTIHSRTVTIRSRLRNLTLPKQSNHTGNV